MSQVAETLAAEAEARKGRRGFEVAGRLSNPWVLRLSALALVLGAWQLWMGGGRVDPTFAAPPSKVATSIPKVVTNPMFVESLLNTLQLFALGFGISLVLGTALGLLLARVPVLDAALSPYVNGLYASPLPAIVPIITAVFGYYLAAKLIIVVLLAIFPILINTYQGARDTDPHLLEVASAFRASELQVWRDVVFPSAIPHLVTGIRLGVARGLIGTVVAETYASPGGLGYLILWYGFRFDMDAMLVVVLCFTLMALVFSGLVRALDRWVARWRVSE
ncbi:MAG TPA: ABC transporter permease [Actinomycetota bacterium]|nr:ABC transporter permease [Actinomycetota bacterium]